MSKEKAPAYQHYPGDYLSDTNTTIMTLEEEGMYRRLMDHCWEDIILPISIDDLTALCKGKQPTPRVLKCFIKTNEGYRHKRLDKEREKQAQHRKSSAKGGRASAHKRKNRKHITPQQGTTIPVPSETQVKGKSSSSSSSSSSNNNIIFDNIMSCWNALDGVCKIRKLGTRRKQTIKNRLKDADWDWQAALNKFPLRCFDGNGYTPTFDFFLRPDTVNGILEGKYDWSKSDGNGSKPKDPDLYVGEERKTKDVVIPSNEEIDEMLGCNRVK